MIAIHKRCQSESDVELDFIVNVTSTDALLDDLYHCNATALNPGRIVSVSCVQTHRTLSNIRDWKALAEMPEEELTYNKLMLWLTRECSHCSSHLMSDLWLLSFCCLLAKHVEEWTQQLEAGRGYEFIHAVGLDLRPIHQRLQSSVNGSYVLFCKRPLVVHYKRSGTNPSSSDAISTQATGNRSVLGTYIPANSGVVENDLGATTALEDSVSKLSVETSMSLSTISDVSLACHPMSDPTMMTAASHLDTTATGTTTTTAATGAAIPPPRCRCTLTPTHSERHEISTTNKKESKTSVPTTDICILL